MRTKNYRNLFLISIWTVVAMLHFFGTIAAQTTAFSFQGRLNAGANPANGNFELQFKLFDSPVGGSQTGPTVAQPNVVVINGIFSTQLDFGAAAFSGAARFVEIGVRSAGDTNPFTILNPRQQVFSTPYAIQAKNAAQLGGIDAAQYVTTSTVGNSFIKNDTAQQVANLNISGNGFFAGNVGIGTAAPTTKLQVQSGGYGVTQTAGGVTVGSFISTAAGGSGWFGTRSFHPLNFFASDGALPSITISTAGNVGVGTTIPTAKLEVRNANAGQTGVYAESASGRAVWGKSVGSRGVYGESTSLEGVFGVSASGAGVSGNSGTNIGVYGESSGSSGVGVYGRNLAGGRAIYAEGNAAQTLSGNGLVKAMLYVQQDGVILRCYNGNTNVSAGNCGFSIVRNGPGDYYVDFGFQVDNRFLSVTSRNPVNPGTYVSNSFRFEVNEPNKVRVRTFIVNVDTLGDDANFMIIIY